MTKENQKKLYEHFVKLSQTDNGIKGRNALKYAKQILNSFPEFEVIETPKQEPKTEPKQKEKKKK